MRLTAGHKRIIKWVGYPLLGLVTFVCAAWASFDAERLRQKAVSTLGKSYDVSIESIEKGLIPGNFTAYGVVFKSRPTEPDEKPTIIVVDELEAKLGLLSLIGAKLSVDFDAVLGGGNIEGGIAVSGSALEIDISTRQLDVGAMPGLKMLFAGLPVNGGLDASIELAVPRDEKGAFSMALANGRMSMKCPMCTVGPGKVVPKMQAGSSRRASVFAQEGVTLPKLNLGDNTIVVEIEDGKGSFGDFQAVSADGEIYAEGYIEFKSPLGKSEVHHCYRFKFSDQAKKKNAKLEGMERGMERARRTDGYIGMRMSGTFDRPKRIGSRSCEPGETPADIRRKRDRERRKKQREERSERQAQRDTTPTVEVKPATPDREATPNAIKLDDTRNDDSDERGGDDNGNDVNIPPPRTSGPPLQTGDTRVDDVKVAEEGDDDDDESGSDEQDGEEGAAADDGEADEQANGEGSEQGEGDDSEQGDGEQPE